MAEKSDNLKLRPPVVAVVGHVDHGKTALLDYIRKTEVVAGEAGGITQSIGAYEVEHDGKKITFIDTPGHEAFSKMRARGASAADIAVLVVSADEGIKQQTKEAIQILKVTETPFVVAITKIDKENANVEKVKNDLMSEEIFLEGLGGNISWQGISSKSGEGVTELLDLLLLMGEVAELKFDPKKGARGFVVESQMDQQRGMVAHLIVKDGILKKGDNIKTLSASGKIKILEDFLGKTIKELEPSSPASVIGFDNLPESGDEFVTGDQEIDTEVVKEEAVPVEREKILGEERPRAILKADTRGSLEALGGILKDEVEVVESSVGDIGDSDIKFAKSMKALIIGFQVKAKKSTINLAEVHGIEIFISKIIYELLDAIKEFRAKEKQEFAGGELEVLAIFNTTPNKQTVGGKVLKGFMRIGVVFEVERDGEVLGKGRVKSLQCDKAEVREAGLDKECGMVIEVSIPIEKGDLLKVVT
ncbi:GTP-binding protein [Patescibacteria group bacterium]|nr:GTP-binding protein [Patescibacteria group bacterium]